MLRLRVRAYSAPNAVGKCRRSASAHLRVLESYGIAAIASAKPGWWEDSHTHALLLEDTDTAEPLGAIRLQRWGSGRALPLESALAGVDAHVHAWVASFSGGGVGELCGLWCSPRLKGSGMGAVLTRMGISIAPELCVRTVLGVCDTRNVVKNTSLGFVRDASLAAGGVFEYPRPGLLAHVLRIPDTRRLDRTTLEQRLAIAEYRSFPVGFELIASARGPIELERDLRIAVTPTPSARSRPFASLTA
jgi:hypothetical protein